MRVAAAAYPLDWQESWESYAEKIEGWVARAEAELLVFPEYGLMELAALAGREVAGDIHRAAEAVAERGAEADALFARLAQEHAVAILGPSGPRWQGDALVNRAGLFLPGGGIHWHDKRIMTPYERDWGIGPGEAEALVEIGGIKTGVLICYDSEFPLQARRLVEQGAELILIPACTDAAHGYYRVRIAALARALEGQCVTVLTPLIGAADWCPAVDENTGAAGVYGPADTGFPADGVIAEGKIDAPGWVRAEIDQAAIARVRENGQVRNMAHWGEQRG